MPDTQLPAYDLREVIAACKGRGFAVAVLSQVLPMQEKQRINEIVRQLCPTAKILELHNAIVPDLPDAQGHLRVATSQPEGLVEAVNVLAGKADDRRKPQKRRGASQK